MKVFDCVDHNRLWKILQEMEISDHLTCLLRNLYVGQEATAEIGVPEDIVPVLRKAGFNLITNIKDEKPQGLQQKIGEIFKKYKLDLQKPSVDEVAAWIEKAQA